MLPSDTFTRFCRDRGLGAPPRDALRAGPDLAARYEALKIELAVRHATDRMRYVTERAEWVGNFLPYCADPPDTRRVPKW